MQIWLYCVQRGAKVFASGGDPANEKDMMEYLFDSVGSGMASSSTLNRRAEQGRHF